MEKEKMTVLLVEDDPNHADLIRKGFEEFEEEIDIFHVSDGEEALDYLFQKGQHFDAANYKIPHVILLDLRMPKIDGIDVLKEIKGSEDLCRVPVVVLTTSRAENDMAQAYDNHVNSYLVKPLEYDDFLQLIRSFASYWLKWNKSRVL